MLSDESLLPYDRPPLSKKYLLGEQAEDAFQLASAEALETMQVDIQLANPVASVDRSRKLLRTTDGGTVAYGTLVAATGASPAY